MGIQTQATEHKAIGQHTRQVRHFGYHCIGPTITPAKIKKLQEALASDQGLRATKRRLTLLAGGRRLDILYLLIREPELCVCDLADMLQTTVSAVSHQLRLLRERGLVRPRRDAQTIYYRLTPVGRRLLRRTLEDV